MIPNDSMYLGKLCVYENNKTPTQVWFANLRGLCFEMINEINFETGNHLKNSVIITKPRSYYIIWTVDNENGVSFTFEAINRCKKIKFFMHIEFEVDEIKYLFFFLHDNMCKLNPFSGMIDFYFRINGQKRWKYAKKIRSRMSANLQFLKWLLDIIYIYIYI